MNFYRIMKNYKNNLWTKDMVKTAVEKGIITKPQYLLITGDIYEDENNPN